MTEQSAPPTRDRLTHLPVLDGLRGIAVLLVLLYHLYPHGQAASSCSVVLSSLSGIGWAGVDLFFVLSGFLITRILLDQRDSPTYFRDFYVRRVLRIFPLYYAFLFAWFMVVPRLRRSAVDLGGMEQYGHYYWLYCSNILFTLKGTVDSHGRNFSMVHTWSLAIEEQFYLAWPLVVLFLSNRALKRTCGLLVVTSLVSRLFFLARGHGAYGAMFFTLSRLDAISVGALLGTLFHEHGGIRADVRRWAAAGAAIASLYLVGGSLLVGTVRSDSLQIATGGYSALALLFGGVLTYAITCSEGSPVARVLGRGLLPFFGKYSYGLYLLHQAVMDAFGWFFVTREGLSARVGIYWGALLFLGIGVVLSTGVAYASYHLFERHFLALKDRLAPHRPSRPPV